MLHIMELWFGEQLTSMRKVELTLHPRSFQQGLMAGGLVRQLSLCNATTSPIVDVVPVPIVSPTWCTNNTFVQSLQDAQSRLWAAIEGARDGPSLPLELFVNRFVAKRWIFMRQR